MVFCCFGFIICVNIDNFVFFFFCNGIDDGIGVRRISDGVDDDDVEEDVEFFFLFGEFNDLVCEI